jgi:hypothetical protein
MTEKGALHQTHHAVIPPLMTVVDPGMTAQAEMPMRAAHQAMRRPGYLQQASDAEQGSLVFGGANGFMQSITAIF